MNSASWRLGEMKNVRFSSGASAFVIHSCSWLMRTLTAFQHCLGSSASSFLMSTGVSTLSTL